MADSERKQSDLNHFRSTGASSRISLDFEKLRNAGWTITERKDFIPKDTLQVCITRGKNCEKCKRCRKKAP